MLKRFVITAVLAIAAFAVIAGCDNDPEQQRSVVTVSSFNCNAPVFSDVLEQGDSVLSSGTGLPDTSDDFIAEDWVQVWFYNRPYNNQIVTRPTLPHGDFLITDYTITWHSSPGGTQVLPSRHEQTSINVPSDGLATGWIRMVSFFEKGDPTIVALQAGGVLLLTAEITFFGHEIGTDRVTSIEVRSSVEFADIFIATGDKDPIEDCTFTLDAN